MGDPFAISFEPPSDIRGDDVRDDALPEDFVLSLCDGGPRHGLDGFPWNGLAILRKNSGDTAHGQECLSGSAPEEDDLYGPE